MIEAINPAELDVVGTVQTATRTRTNGEERITSWANTYSNVWSKQLRPLRQGEAEESKQQTALERNSFVVRMESRSIVPKDMRYLIGSKAHMIVGVRPYKMSRNYLVLDTEYRDEGSN